MPHQCILKFSSFEPNFGMQHLEAKAKKFKHENSIWNTAEFIWQWGIPGMSGIGTGVGYGAIAADKHTQIGLAFLSIGLFSLVFQVFLGFWGISFITRKKTELSKQEKELQKQIDSAKEIHLQLDNYRDAMLFDQCNKYWDLLDKLGD